MKVYIKEFDVEMELKNKGIELDVADPQGNHIGDLVITKTQLIWCKGKTSRENGRKWRMDDFIAWVEQNIQP